MEILVSHPLPLLRGLVKVEGEELTWTGKWAFGKEGHAEKKTNKFALRTPLSSVAGVSAEGKIESAATITFSGFFKLTKTEGGGVVVMARKVARARKRKSSKLRRKTSRLRSKSRRGKRATTLVARGKISSGTFFSLGVTAVKKIRCGQRRST